MSDLIVAIAASILGVYASIAIFCNPFVIGKERKPYSASNYLFELSWAISVFVVVGRIFGWW